MWETSMYSIISYIGLKPIFSNIIIETKVKFTSNLSFHVEGKNIIDMKNNLVIVDEAHEILNNTTGELIEQTKLEFNYNLFLMTGTPIVNTPKTFIKLISMLTGKDFKNAIDISDHVIDIKIKKEFINEIQEELNDKVSYFELSSKSIAKYEFIGTDLYGINVVKCPMSSKQLEIYRLIHTHVGNEMFQQIMTNSSMFAIKNIFTAEVIRNLIDGTKISNLIYKDGLLRGDDIDDLSTSSKLKNFFGGLIEGKFPGKLFCYFSSYFI